MPLSYLRIEPTRKRERVLPAKNQGRDASYSTCCPSQVFVPPIPSRELNTSTYQNCARYRSRSIFPPTYPSSPRHPRRAFFQCCHSHSRTFSARYLFLIDGRNNGQIQVIRHHAKERPILQP